MIKKILSNLTYFWILKNYYLIKNKNLFSFFVIIFCSYFFSPEVTLAQESGEVLGTKLNTSSKIIVDFIIIFGLTIVLTTFIKENFFNQVLDSSSSSISQNDQIIRDQV